jgi:hypothetical protein
MIWQGPRKVPDKVKKRVANSKVPFAIRNSKRVHKRVGFATMFIILVVILGTIILNSGSSRTVAYANSMRGVGVGIYWDQACTKRTLSLDWGHIEAGSSNTLTVYIKNEGDSAVSLWMATSNWAPSLAFSYLTLTWTYTSRILNVDEVIPVELILNVSPAISGITDFSFDTVITITG